MQSNGLVLLLVVLTGLLTLIAYAFVRLVPIWNRHRDRLSQLLVFQETVSILKARANGLPAGLPLASDGGSLVNHVKSLLNEIASSGLFGGTGDKFLQKMVTDSAGTGADMVLFLDGLARILDGRRKSASALNLVRWRPESPQPEAAQVRLTQELMPNEAAVLAAVSEKLYASWTFRFVGAMLVAAALFAVAGTVVIGNQTINLKQDLRSEGDQAKKDIDDLQRLTRESITGQQKQLTDSITAATNMIQAVQAQTTKDIQDRQLKLALADAALSEKTNQLSAKADSGKETIDNLVKNFSTATDQLKTKFTNDTQQLRVDAVKDIVTAIRASLDTNEKSLRQEILTPLEKLRDTDVADIHTKVDGLRQAADSLNRDVTTAHAKLAAVSPDLDSLQTTLQRARETDKDITAAKTTLSAKVDETSRLASDAKNASATATKQAADIAAAQKKIEDTANPVLIAAGVLQVRMTELNATADRIAENQRHRQEAAAQEARALGDLKQATDDLKTLQQNLKALQAQVADIQSSADSGKVLLAQARPALNDLATTGDVLTAIRSRVAAFQPAIDEITAREAALSIALDDAARELPGVVKVKQTIHDTTDGVDDLRSRITHAAEAVAGVEAKAKALTLALDAINAGLPHAPHPAAENVQAEPPVALLPQEIVPLQKALIAAHFLTGKPDGIIGTHTTEAIRAFQGSLNQSSTGQLTASQRDRLLGRTASQPPAAITPAAVITQ